MTVHGTVFDGSLNDVLSIINTRPVLSTIQSQNAPQNVVQNIYGGVKDLLKNRVDIPSLPSTENGVRHMLSQTVEEAKAYLDKWKNSAESPMKQQYLNGIDRAMDIVQAYIASPMDVYKILESLNELVRTHSETHATIIDSEKPYYAGLISGLLNFLDKMKEEVKMRQAMALTYIAKPYRQVNLPDMMPGNTQSFNFLP